MRRRARRGFAAVLCLVALVALRIGAGKLLGSWVLEREKARFTTEVGAIDLASIAAPEVPPDRNAARAIQRAVAGFELEAFDVDQLDRADRGTLGGFELGPLLSAHAAALDDLAAAAALPASSFGPRQELFHLDDETFAAWRWLIAARVVWADGTQALARGDESRLERDLATLHGMTRAVRREPAALFGIIGGGLELRQLDLLQRALAAGQSPLFLDSARRELDELAALPAPDEVVRGEAVLGTAMLERDIPAPRRAPTARERLEGALWPWSEGHVIAGYVAGWRPLVELSRTPQTLWPPTARRGESAGRRLRRWVDPTVPDRSLGSFQQPNLLGAVRKLQFIASGEQLARLAVAVARRSEDAGSPRDAFARSPESRRPDPSTGSLPRFEARGDGTVLLSLPALEALAAEEKPLPGSTAAARRAALARWVVPIGAGERSGAGER